MPKVFCLSAINLIASYLHRPANLFLIVEVSAFSQLLVVVLDYICSITSHYNVIML